MHESVNEYESQYWVYLWVLLSIGFCKRLLLKNGSQDWEKR